MRLESRINPKFLTLSENRISCVPTMIDDGKQWHEDRKGVKKRMASVLSSLSLSWLLHIHAFMSSVHDCRSCVRLCMSFGGVDFWSWVSSAKSWWLIDWLIDDHLYSAILRSLEQTHCARLWFYMSDKLFYSAFFWISTEVVYLQRWHGWCHMKLQPSRRKFCVHHTTMHHVTSCKATYVRCMCV